MKIIKSFLWYGLVAVVMASASSAEAQQVTGELGSPGATTTIDGKQLPPPDPTVRWRDQGESDGIEIVVAASHRATEGRAQCAPHHDGRLRIWRAEHVWRRRPDAGAGSSRKIGSSLHPVSFDSALLTDARGADHWPQPSRSRLWCRGRSGDGISGLRLGHREGLRNDW